MKLDMSFSEFVEESIINTGKLKRGVGKVTQKTSAYISGRGDYQHASSNTEETSYFKITKKQGIEVMDKLEKELNRNPKPITMTYEDDPDNEVLEIIPEFYAEFLGGNEIILRVLVKRSDAPYYGWAVVSESDKKEVENRCYNIVKEWVKEEIFLETPNGEPVNIANSILKGKVRFDDDIQVEVEFAGRGKGRERKVGNRIVR